MKIYLAGAELGHFCLTAALSGHKHVLMSYYSWQLGKSSEVGKATEIARQYDLDVIVDSGLFSFMFGAGKDTKHDFESMRKYAIDYVEFCKTLNLPKLTIIECDAQKVIGSDGVKKIREEVFEKCGLKVMYVWHVEDKIEGLQEMTQKYDYLGLGCPELRKVFKGNESNYHEAIDDLLHRIQTYEPNLRKVHLLGNTVYDDLKTHLSYSADSTSWLSSCRYGAVKMLGEHGFKTMGIRDPAFIQLREQFFADRPEILKAIYDFKSKETFREYLKIAVIAAYNVALFQSQLDRRFAWAGKETV